EQFRDQLRPQLEAKGWWGKQTMEDPLTGKVRPVQLGSNQRLRTIFDVNLRSAYQAGRWKKIQEVKGAFPFLRYVAVQDARTRPEHRAWHGVILPIDHPWWETHYPPCGWRCRCSVQLLNQRTMDRRNFFVTEDADIPRFEPRPWTNPRTGEILVVEKGIDPGFNFNIGKAYLDPITPRPTPPRGGASAAFAPIGVSGPGLRPRPGPALLEEAASPAAARSAFLSAFDLGPGQARILRDVAGEELAIGPALFEVAGG